MNKFIRILTLLLLVLFIISCGDEKPAEETDEQAENQAGITVENAFIYKHVNGHGKETDTVAFVLFEFEQLASIKYQVLIHPSFQYSVSVGKRVLLTEGEDNVIGVHKATEAVAT